jgi:hypothetical protein
MTRAAVVKESDLHRMAKIAKRDNVTVWMEIDGRRIGVSPEPPDANPDKKVALPKDFAF